MTSKIYSEKAGLITASGNDRIDFFNRVSTNTLLKIIPDVPVLTFFLNDKGRIIDLAAVIDKSDYTEIYTTYQNTEKLAEFLEKYIIMDDVEIKISGNDNYRVMTTNDNVEQKLNFFKIRDVSFYYTADKPKSDIDEMSDIEFEKFRITKGIPSANELNENINPLELALTEFISFNKGCYIGQEVIARLDSQGKVPKKIVHISGSNELFQGSKIYNSEKQECGFISSAYNYGDEHTGLGFIRSTMLDLNRKFFTEQNTELKINIFK